MVMVELNGMEQIIMVILLHLEHIFTGSDTVVENQRVQ